MKFLLAQAAEAEARRRRALEYEAWLKQREAKLGVRILSHGGDIAPMPEPIDTSLLRLRYRQRQETDVARHNTWSNHRHSWTQSRGFEYNQPGLEYIRPYNPSHR